MISIQDLGLSIMSDAPKPFYIVGGSEYGIKDKYIDTLTQFYGKKEEYPSVSDVVNFLSVKHLIPVPPALYVIRYDEAFVSSAASMIQKINSLKFQGTIFCIYNEQKHIDKLDKSFPNCTAVVEPVNPKFIEKYLHSDFPKLDDRSIKIATQCATSYGHARTICKSMIHADPSVLARMPEKELARLFGCSDMSAEVDIQKAIAARNFPAACQLLENYDEDQIDNLVYTILQTMIEMEKILTSKYSDSPLKEYAKLWKLEDVYHMFMNAYTELDKLRSNTSTDIKASLIYLFGLFTFKDIPSVEVMNSDC